VVRPAYAPALVAFYGDPHTQVSVSVGAPMMGWVALSWGEPCVPWWGRPGFIHRPWWGGWGGPRIVNNVVVHRTTVVRTEEIHVYRNAGVRNGIVAIHKDRFGHGRIPPERFDRAHAENLRPMHKGPEVRPTPAAFAPDRQRGIRPAERKDHSPQRKPDAATARAAEPRIVHAPQQPKNTEPLPRPPFGKGTVERRPEPGRAQPSMSSKNEGTRRAAEPSVETRAPSGRQLEQPSRPPQRHQPAETPDRRRMEKTEKAEDRTTPSPSAPNPAQVHRQPQQKLPGEPASQLSPNRTGSTAARQFERSGKTPQRTEPHEAPPERPRPPQTAPSQNSKGQRPGNAALPPGSGQ
jgi:hypothetical protein